MVAEKPERNTARTATVTADVTTSGARYLRKPLTCTASGARSRRTFNRSDPSRRPTLKVKDSPATTSVTRLRLGDRSPAGMKTLQNLWMDAYRASHWVAIAPLRGSVRRRIRRLSVAIRWRRGPLTSITPSRNRLGAATTRQERSSGSAGVGWSARWIMIGILKPPTRAVGLTKVSARTPWGPTILRKQGLLKVLLRSRASCLTSS